MSSVCFQRNYQIDLSEIQNLERLRNGNNYSREAGGGAIGECQ